MSVFNNGFFDSSITQLVDNVNALKTSQQSYFQASTSFVADVEALGGIVADQFTNPATHDFDGNYSNLYTATVPAGLVWCAACCQVKSQSVDIAVTQNIFRLVDSTGTALSPEQKKFYAGSQNDITYFALSGSWIFNNPVEQPITLQGATLQTGEITAGQYALLNPSGGVGAFGAGTDIQGAYRFVMLKPNLGA